jgi:hypothetical protein
MRRSRPRRAAALAAATALLLSACAGDGAGGDDAEAEDGEAEDGDAAVPEQELGVAVASYDLAVGEGQRLIAGVLSPERAQLAFGEVEFQIGHLGDEPSGEADLGDSTTATYLPVLGLEPEGEPSDQPTLLVGRTGTGVYETEVDLDQPGYWGLRVVAQLEDGTVREGQTAFEVLPESEVPEVGDEAPASDNLTIADVESGDAPPVAVDSRAQGDDAEVPDEILHDTTVAEAIEAGRPAVVILSTPTYCVSAFCGPLTEELAALAPEYEDVVDFIHIEVWRDFDERELNEAAAEWIQTQAGGNEPWVFLVDGDGMIEARWDNVLDVEDLEARLQAL